MTGHLDATARLRVKSAPPPPKSRGSTSPLTIAENPNYAFLVETGWDDTHGSYDAEKPQVIPYHKRLVRIEFGRASMTIGLASENWSSEFGRALAFPKLGDVTGDENLNLAIDLYAESRALVIPRTRFLTLVIALEALLPDAEIAAEAQAVLQTLKDIAQTARDGHQRESDVWKELDNLLSRVRELKRKSIGSALRRFVSAAVEAHAELGNAATIAKTVSNTYNVRSTLVHDGTADESAVSEGLTFLSDFIPRLLKALFVQTAA